MYTKGSVKALLRLCYGSVKALLRLYCNDLHVIPKSTIRRDMPGREPVGGVRLGARDIEPTLFA
jgi:hypothetical protein